MVLANLIYSCLTFFFFFFGLINYQCLSSKQLSVKLFVRYSFEHLNYSSQQLKWHIGSANKSNISDKFI